MKTIDTTKARIEVAKIAIESIKMLAHLEGTDLATLLAELNNEDSQLNAATPAVTPAAKGKGKKATTTTNAAPQAPAAAPFNHE